MSTAPLWQSSDGELLAELGALETQLGADVVGHSGNRFPGHRRRERVRHDGGAGAAIARGPRSEARSRVDAPADVLPSCGLGGGPVGPRLPQTAAAVADHAIGAAEVAVIRSVLRGCRRTSVPSSGPRWKPNWPARPASSMPAVGGVELSGWLDREAAEIVRAALSPLAAPRPATDVEVNLRTGAQRDADALSS
jgi:hypothetical protein